MILADLGNAELSLALNAMIGGVCVVAWWAYRKEVLRREMLEARAIQIERESSKTVSELEARTLTREADFSAKLAALERDATRKLYDLERAFAVAQAQECHERVSVIEGRVAAIDLNVHATLSAVQRLERWVDNQSGAGRNRRAGDPHEDGER